MSNEGMQVSNHIKSGGNYIPSSTPPYPRAGGSYPQEMYENPHPHPQYPQSHSGLPPHPYTTAPQRSHMGQQAYPIAVAPTTCLVCYNPHVEVMLEPCHHQFHSGCLERNANKENLCPICWVPIQTHRPVQLSALHHPNGPHHSHRGVSAPPSHLPPQQYGIYSNRNSGRPPSSHEHPHSPMSSTMKLSAVNGLLADGLHGVASNPNMNSSNQNNVRKGKWTTEESAFCDRLIEEFKKGNLPLAEGTTLRTFLSKLLNCDPMRISKKYTGDQCIGKIIFRRREDEISKEEMATIRKELAELESTYLDREQYNQRRREKRMESELSREKSRFASTGRPSFEGMENLSLTSSGPRSTPSPSTQPRSMSNKRTASQMKGEPQLSVQIPSPSTHNSGPSGTSSMTPQFQAHSIHSNTNMMGDKRMNAPEDMPRVSSIDSFSCFFPRVASIENINSGSGSTSGQSGGIPKSNSISDALNGYFPSMHSMEQLSSLLDNPDATVLKRERPERPTIESLDDRNHKDNNNNTGGDNDKMKQDPSSGLPPKLVNVTIKDENIKGYSNPPGSAPAALGMKPLIRSSSGIFPRVSSMDKLPRVPSLDKLPRVPSMDKLPRVPSMDKLPRIPSMDKLHSSFNGDRFESNNSLRSSDSTQWLSRFGSSDQLNHGFPSFSSLPSSTSFDKLSGLASSSSGDLRSSSGSSGSQSVPGKSSSFLRNSSIEDILSLVASADSTSSSFSSIANGNGQHIQLSALANIAGEEASQLQSHKKRRKQTSSS